MRQIAMNFAKGVRIGMILAAALIVAALPASGQKKNKNAPPPDLGEDLKTAMHTPDGQAIDQAIGEELGYWQIGDTVSLHKYYSDDVVLVSGAYEPPNRWVG